MLVDIEREGGERVLLRFEINDGRTYMSLVRGVTALSVGKEELLIDSGSKLEVIIRELSGVFSAKPREGRSDSDNLEIDVVRGDCHFPITLGKVITANRRTQNERFKR